VESCSASAACLRAARTGRPVIVNREHGLEGAETGSESDPNDLASLLSGIVAGQDCGRAPTPSLDRASDEQVSQLAQTRLRTFAGTFTSDRFDSPPAQGRWGLWGSCLDLQEILQNSDFNIQPSTF